MPLAEPEQPRKFETYEQWTERKAVEAAEYQVKQAAWRAEEEAARAAQNAAEAEARLNPVGRTLRCDSASNGFPCITASRGRGQRGVVCGQVVAETAKFWTVVDLRGDKYRVGKASATSWGAHLAPCPRCEDHPDTLYPPGYSYP